MRNLAKALPVGAVILSNTVHFANAFSASTTTTPNNVASSPTTSKPKNNGVLSDFDHHTSSRLPWSPTGYSTWRWPRYDADINYIELGDASKPALLLVHGFGASAYHYRFNLPVLARNYHVYAFDLLGFGLSDKPIREYGADVWRDQALDFIEEVIGEDNSNGGGVTIAGNSIGGYTAMCAAADERGKTNGSSSINGCVLLNAAGKFRDPDAPPGFIDIEPPPPNPIIEAISSTIQRLIIQASFVYTKRPARIAQVLRQVYPTNPNMVDADLVESIRLPSTDDNAAEVFYRVISKVSSGPKQKTVDEVMEGVECPVLLAWGEEDPWIRSAAADRIEALVRMKNDNRISEEGGGDGGDEYYCSRVSIDAGHCPHDESPEEVNAAILEFMDNIVWK